MFTVTFHVMDAIFPNLSLIPVIDQCGIEERAKRFTARSLKGEVKLAALKLAVSMLDVTTLEGADTAGKVKQMCVQAARPGEVALEVGHAAAVCVYPSMVSVARESIDQLGVTVKVASVATAFPSGQAPLHLRLEDVRYAVEQGADEVDMVISRGMFLAGQYEEVFDEIVKIKDACGDAHLKVIIETGELKTFDNIRMASELAMHAGADFIKTSTGKVGENATLANTLVMLYAIKDYYEKSGRKVGMKPAGGISKAKLALQYLVMVREVLGSEWLSADLFRFGASSLTVDLMMQIKKQVSGRYQSACYFSKS